MLTSVLLATYNSDWDKTRRTLYSIISQKKTIFELIVCDDGSCSNNFERIELYLNENNFKNYSLIANKKNQGTIKNILSGLAVAKGKYIKPISPGDFFYKEDSLYEIEQFAEKSKCSACFGRAVYYSLEGENITTHAELCNPRDFRPFIHKSSIEIKKSLLLCGNYILGASLFYKKDDFIEALIFSQQKMRFCEDIAATFYMAAKNKKINFAYLSSSDSKKECIPFIWYEQGIGISTANNGNFLRQIHENEKLFIYMVKKCMIPKIYFIAKFSKNPLTKKIVKNILMPIKYIHDKFKIPFYKIVPMKYDVQYLFQLLHK